MQRKIPKPRVAKSFRITFCWQQGASPSQMSRPSSLTLTEAELLLESQFLLSTTQS